VAHHAFSLYAHITCTRGRIGCILKVPASIKTGLETRPYQDPNIGQAVLADHVHVLVSFRPIRR